jgi:hypothetical protein
VRLVTVFLVPRSILNRFFVLSLVYTFAPRFITNQFSSHTYAAAQVYVFPKHSGPLTNNTVKLTRKKERIKTTRQLLKRGMCLSRKSSRWNQKLSVRFIRCRKRISFSTLGDSFKIPALCVFQSCPIVLCVCVMLLFMWFYRGVVFFPCVYITDFLGGYFSILFLLEAIRDECWTGREREPIIDPRYSMLGPLTASQSSFSLCVCVCLSLCPGLFLLRTCDEGSTKQKYQGSAVCLNIGIVERERGEIGGAIHSFRDGRA